METLTRVLLLLDYNTRLVVLSTSLLGVASGLIGSFLLLRKRSLMGDALSHATLPGIALAFLLLVALGGDGKLLPGLLAGAALTGVLGFLAVQTISGLTRIKDDAAMGIILSVFFGAGIVLLGFIQSMPEGSAAGLQAFIYGKAASMVLNDFLLLATVAVLCIVASLLLFKEFRLLCFDTSYARSQGWPTALLDTALLALVTGVTVAGLQAVGLILIIAFLIIPAAAARMWTHRFGRMLALAGLLGGLSGWGGASASALAVDMPAGAIIVLTASAIFGISLLAGPDRGLVARYLRHRQLKRRIGRQHFLRAMFEHLEPGLPEGQPLSALAHQPVPLDKLLPKRSWTPRRLQAIAADLYHEALIEQLNGEAALTEHGLEEAARVTRNHRLWELYLMEHADIAPSHVDRDADTVEHILGEAITRHLEQSLPQALRTDTLAMPASPHQL